MATSESATHVSIQIVQGQYLDGGCSKSDSRIRPSGAITRTLLRVEKQPVVSSSKALWTADC